ncbi:leishmanolysin-related zinc metalloendopeptidase [uncultured Croceitalea sp.]|uniref:leishmanolysin-related zinc metalloendopeptidase n=1 Tax=uncultured Croceitalea sp. TaxID=1798908 RepID=UPI0033061F62
MSFTIQIRFLGGLTPTQQTVFEVAANRWAQIITENLPPVRLDNGEIIDDVRIDAQGATIDGDAGILGQAGPTQLRSGSLLPATGMMRFDSADLARLEIDGSLLNVIIHEMAHVLGFGTLWSPQFLNLITGEGSDNPLFIGENAKREYTQLIGGDTTEGVPVANTGGPGTRDGHWRESIFDNELMTGFINSGENPVSRMSIASFEDMGYSVSYEAADEFVVPSTDQFALRQPNLNLVCSMCSSKILRCDPIVLPESAFL